MLITQQGKILRMASSDIRSIGRATQGVRLIDIEGDDRAVSIARLAEKDEERLRRESRGSERAEALGAERRLRSSGPWRSAACGCASAEEQTAPEVLRGGADSRHARSSQSTPRSASIRGPKASSRRSR